MNQLILEFLSESNQGDLGVVYKEVFKGAPWYEDRICSGALLSPEDESRCTRQYTSNEIPREISGVIGSINFAQTKNCLACQRQLIEFYPEYVDQNALITEAQRLPEFYGLLARIDEQLAGFCWGYTFPKVLTRSVDFPRAASLLAADGIEGRMFYWAEIGVVDRFRNRGYGGIMTRALMVQADRENYEWLTLRTKNEAVQRILRYLFPREQIHSAFDDPVRGTPWYAIHMRKMRELHISSIE